VRDFLAGMTSSEITGWLAYLHKDDEVRAAWTTHAIAQAFGAGGRQQQREEEEEVIDTTDPEFAKHFQGFIRAPQSSIGRQQQQSTEIKFG
jgi:hypothetical protein